MVQAAYNEKGITLIEILVSILLTAIVFTGLVQSSVIVMNTNINNSMRDEAVNIAEEGMDDVRNMPFNVLSAGTTTVTINRDFRGITAFPFTRVTKVTNINTNNMQVTVTVWWTRRGASYNHNITTVMRSPIS